MILASAATAKCSVNRNAQARLTCAGLSRLETDLFERNAHPNAKKRQLDVEITPAEIETSLTFREDSSRPATAPVPAAESKPSVLSAWVLSVDWFCRADNLPLAFKTRHKEQPLALFRRYLNANLGETEGLRRRVRSCWLGSQKPVSNCLCPLVNSLGAATLRK
jgi:hypothetical protein